MQLRLLKWAFFVVLIASLGVMLATDLPISTKLLALFCVVALLVLWVKAAFVQWFKSIDQLPTWDEIKSIPPTVPEPPFKGGGIVARTLTDWSAKWIASKARKGDRNSFNAMGEFYEIGTKYTPKSASEAMRWYKAAVGGGNPAEAHGPYYAKIRIAEMYEDGEGVERDLDLARRIYATLPNHPSAMLHFAIAHIEGKAVPKDYVEAYRLLLTADKFHSMNPMTRKELQIDVRKHRNNRNHIRVRELMTILEPHMKPEQLLKGKESAREWWNAHR